MQGSPRIIDRRTGEIVDARVISDLSQAVLTKTEALFRAWRDKATSNRLPDVGPPLAASDWNWGRKGLSEDAATSRFFGISCDGTMQGLMMLNMKPVRSWLPNTADMVLYLEYIEAAPWNQQEYAGDAAQFAGIGILLLRTAIRESVDAGYGGRLALHSLPASEGFYRPHFEDMGVDPIEGLRYFEMDAARAEKVLTGDRR